MTANNLSLAKCTDPERWDAFVARSPHGSIFCRTPFLDSLGVDYELWWVEEGGNQRTGVVVLKDDTGQPIRAPFAFSLYQGVLLDGEQSQLPVHRRVKKTLGVLEFLLAELERRDDRISFCLHPQFEDVRAFSWFHYREPGRGRFQIQVRYTGWIDLGSWHEFDAYLATVRESRRYEYRRALREGLAVEVSRDLEALQALYRLTFERQGIEVSPATEQRMRAIAAAALSQGFGELLLCRTPDGDPASATLFLHDDRHGYYLIGANNPAYRDTGSGTFLLLENIRRCQARGLERVDVCGMNSPDRGDFKTSVNAAPVPYIVATWERPLRT